MSRKTPFLVAVLAFCAALPAFSSPSLLSADVPARLRSAARSNARVAIAGVDLGEPKLSTLSLEPMKVWADDARIAIHRPDGTVENLAPPRILSFKGTVDDDQESAVYISLSQEDGTVSGIVVRGEKRYSIGSGHRLSGLRGQRDAQEPVFVHEVDAVDDTLDAEQATPWTCGLDTLGESHPHVFESSSLKLVTNGSSVAGSSYQMRLAIETDTELYAAFGSEAAVSAYLTTLVGQASVIYQRDLGTTLTIGHTNIYSGGTDPWNTAVASGTAAMLSELGKVYHNTNTSEYAQVQRSAVVMISGKLTSGGIAWRDVLCDDDFYCGDTGASCGSATFAGAYAGPYAYCGSSGSVTTTVPDPTLTVNGVQYGLPSGGNFWMLDEFAHELGHVVAAQHTHCVTLSAAEQALYGVTRGFVDTCYAGEGGCYSGSTSAPTEKGSIMSYCHNLSSGGFRQSRYLFGKSGEASEKMLAILKGSSSNGLQGSVPNGAMTTQAEPLACSAGRTASVASCTGCTYGWQIAGGTITSSTTGSSITYTPTGTSVTLTVTVTSQKGCGITVVKTLATSCSALSAPSNVVAAATSGSNIQVTWTAAAGATSYNIYRSADNVNYTMVSTAGTVTGTVFNDAVSTNKAYVYKVRSVNGSESADSNRDFAVALAFTDPTLSILATSVKAAHVTELRTAVNALRTLNGNQAAFTFTDPTLTAGVSTAKALHLSELQVQVNAVRIALGFSAVGFTETPVAGSTTIRKSHIDELRAAVQ